MLQGQKAYRPGFSPTLAWENAEGLEGMVGGEGASHSVNGITIQTQGNATGGSTLLHLVDKEEIRNISDSLLLLTYSITECMGPAQTQEIEADSRDAVHQAQKNLVLLLACLFQP